MLDAQKSPKRLMSPGSSPHSAFSSMVARRALGSNSISGSILGNTSSLSLMRPLMGLSSPSLDFNFSGLALDTTHENYASRSASSTNSSEAVLYFKPSQPFEKYDLSKEFQGASTSINFDELEQSPAAPLIEAFLEPWLTSLSNVRTSSLSRDTSRTSSSQTSVATTEEDVSETSRAPLASVADVAASLKEFARSRPVAVQELLDALNAPRLLVPYLDLDLPVDTILEYNELDADDPQILSLQLDPVVAPEIRELSVFVDRYDTEKGVVCLLIWSNIDEALVCLPSLGLQPYPLCWKCNSSFGLIPCTKCGVAKYCSVSCMHDQERIHRKACPDMSNFVRRHQLLVFERPYLAPRELNHN
eukprot:TRINITY_DN6262_c0_g1_i1.p1 TRINITY_DN6262_c0_g1~~TRINITY_DN6262_c0_g1_i1.p1  ORF type:complete len:360 (+),score=41.03 TRINITY_DN6262_c0_g1_i1:244-1323(+)